MDQDQRFALWQSIAKMSDHQLFLAVQRQQDWEAETLSYEGQPSARLCILQDAAIHRLQAK